MPQLLRRTIAEKELRVWGRKSSQSADSLLDSITGLQRSWAKSFSHPDWGSEFPEMQRSLSGRAVWQSSGILKIQHCPILTRAKPMFKFYDLKKAIGGKEAEFHRFYMGRFYTASQVLDTGTCLRNTFLSDLEYLCSNKKIYNYIYLPNCFSLHNLFSLGWTELK